VIFSIGYQRLTVAELARLAEQLDAVVWDVRGVPVSRKRGFGRRQLEAALGSRYEWHGATLGNKGAHAVTLEGLAELAAEARHVILLCQEEAPGECHRHHQIALPLVAQGVHVMHIYRDEIIDAAELERAAVSDDDYDCVALSDFLATIAA
jgi:hypothetical protein